MQMLKQLDDEIYSVAATSDKLSRLLPEVEVVHHLRGPRHMEDQRAGDGVPGTSYAR